MEDTTICLVTGCNGFLGRALSRALIKRKYTVVGVCRSEPRQPIAGLEECVVGDLSDRKIVQNIFRNHAISHIFHLAGITEHAEIVGNKICAFENSLLATLFLGSEFVKSPARYFFYPSSGKVYKNTELLPLGEDASIKPMTALGEIKAQVERVLSFYQQENKRIVVGRIFNVYGPGQKIQFLLPTIISQLRVSDEVRLGSIEHIRDYLYLEDVITAILTTLEIPEEGFLAINIGSGVGVTAGDIVDHIGNLLDRKIKIITESSRMRSGEPECEIANNSLIRSYGWTPKWEMKRGLGNVLQEEFCLE